MRLTYCEIETLWLATVRLTNDSPSADSDMVVETVSNNARPALGTKMIRVVRTVMDIVTRIPLRRLVLTPFRMMRTYVHCERLHQSLNPTSALIDTNGSTSHLRFQGMLTTAAPRLASHFQPARGRKASHQQQV